MKKILKHIALCFVLLIPGYATSFAQSCTFPNQTVTVSNTVLNTYYPGNASIVSGATSITLGAATGSVTPIAAGDLVLIIQMQDATQNSANTDAYGNGVAGNPASGFLVANAGFYEFGIATNAVPLAGGTLNLLSGTTNAYNNAAASGTQGQITYQVIRIPRFNNLTINAGTSITGTAWNGSTGGVVCLDVNGTLNMNTTGTIQANAMGFRGGGGRQLGGGGGANTDIRTLATVNNNAAKGEGICGTPRYVFNGTVLVNTGVEGYPNGSNANGAPGNAGGGGTDGDPANNDENTGGGGGSNAGAGGRGGRSWNSNLNVGGFGGVAPAFLANTRLIMGGGGGSGTSNDGTGPLGAGLSSSGGIGGGLIILKVNTITNAGTISANGANGSSVDNDGGGGGGAGGSVYVSATVTASLATLTINTIGGNGGSAWATIADAGAANDGNPEHGPGGGGGGGAIYTNGAIVAGSSVAGGTNGITTTSNLAFGATGGTAGVRNTGAAAITLPTLPAPTAGSNSPVCIGGTLNLTSTPTLASATYSWTGPNSFVSAVQNPSIVGITAPGAGTYTVNYTLGNCTSANANTLVVLTTPPTASNAGPDQTICTSGGSATMAANTPAVGTGTWTQISGPVTGTITTPGSATTTITGLTTAGTYVFQWSITNAPCVASTDQISVVVNAPPTASNAGPDASVCGLTATLAGNVPAIGTGTWTQVAGPGTSVFTNANLATSGVTVSIAGAYTFRWTITNAPCTASQDNVIITFVATPTTSNAGPDQTICTTGGSATMAGNTPAVGTGTWTQISGPVTGTITTPGSATTTITGLTTAGTYVFQWSITNAPCAASTDQISVVVNAAPTAANAGPDQTICTTGGSATMAGNTPAVGTGTWTQISGPVTGTITTPGSATTTITGLTTAGTYVFQWTITNAPCVASTDQISVIVNAPPTVSNAGPDASVCGLTATLAGNVPTTGTGTWTQVAGPGTSVFTNANLATSNVTVSLAGAYTFRWTIANAPCAASQDNVIITFVATPTTSNAGPDQTICTTGGSATMAGNTPAVGTGTWTQISGPVTGTITTPGSATTTITGLTTAGTYVFQWSITNAPCVASTDQISVIVNAPPTASNAGPDASVCGLTATLAGNVPTTGTGTWTQVAGPGTSVFTNANLATSNVTVSLAGAYTFRWTIANAPCAASQDNVIITFVATPTTSNAGPDQTICTTGGSATMAGNTPAVGTGTWTQISGPVTGTITTPGSATTTITGLTTAGTYVFQWSIANAPCAASTDQISVVVNAPPTASNAGPDQSLCGLTTTLAGNTAAIGTGTWTQVSGPGTSSFTNANSPTSNVTVSIIGTYVFQWTITNAPCVASSDQIQVIFSTAPTTANAGPDQTICTTGGSATMAGNTPAVGTGTWTQISGPVTGTITTPGSATTTITGLTTAGTYVFQWSITNGSCAPSTDQISVIVNAPPTASNAGPDASVCGLTATLAGNVPTTGTGTWTQIAGPGTSVFTNANLATSNVTVSIAGVYTFRWTIANAPCAASQDNVIITFVATPTTSNAGPDQTICTTGGSATMAGNTPAVGTGTWTQISGPVTGTITTPGSATTTITGLTTAGTYVFQWSITNAPCAPSTDQISVVVNAPPTASNAGPDASVCGLTATLAGNVPTTGTGTWTQVAGPGTSVFTNANLATSNVTVSIAGAYTFRWTITNAPCTASQDNVIITFVATPTTSNAGPDQTICTTGGSATMAGNTPAVGTGTWTQISGPVTGTITTPGSATTTITGLTTAGTYVFQWSITNAPCAASTDQISVIVNAPPTASNAGPDASVCGLTATLAGNVPTTGTGTWTQVAGPGTSVFTNANLATSNVTVSIAGAYTFRWTITNAPCTASQDNVIITFVATPTTSNAGPDQTICTTGGSATMAGNTPAVGTGTWTQISGPVTGTITTPGSATTTITGLTTAGTYVFQWSITNAPCAASTDQISVVVNAPPTASNAGPDASVCGLTATLAGNVPTTGTGTWTQVAGPGTSVFTNANLATSNVTVSLAGAYTFRWTITNAPCAASQDNVIITFVATPTTSNAGPDQTICTTGGSATMAGNTPAVGTGTWTQISGPVTGTITTPGSATTTITGLTTAGTYVFQWSITNAPCAASTDQISVIVNAPPTASNAGPDASVCGLTATLAGNVPTTGTGTWTQVAGPGTSVFTNANLATSGVTVSIPGSYTYQWTITNAPCVASTDQVQVIFWATPSLANAGVDQSICSTLGSAVMTGNIPVVGTGTWTQISGPSAATIVTPGSANSTITGLTSAGTYVFQWTITNGACPSSSDQISVTVSLPPTASAAGPDQNANCGLIATLAGSTVAVGTGTWTQISGPGTSVFANANDPNSTVTVSVIGTYVYQWTITNAPCAASSDQVSITFIICDNDGDGIADAVDPDDDNDGILDTVEGTGDTDGDGISDAFDLDSDNDGIPDVTEAGGNDPDGDGIIGTGVVTDTDNDGLADAVDPDNGGTVLPNPDTDGDGHPNYLDLDADNDGIPDVTEAGGSDPDGDGIIGTGPITDSDGDGLSNISDPTTGGTPLPNPDSDGDGIVNVLDLDSDNDGITDVVEGGGSDPDGDGIIGSGPITDTDGDGLSNITDPSTGGTPLPLPNTDGLAGANYIDIDSDNDGIVDNIEGQTSGGYVAPSGLDTDGDGLDNAYDTNNGGVAIVPVNTDGTDNVDYLDLDSDNDGDLDALEGWDTDNNGTANTIPSGVDADNDGLDDAYDNNDLAWNPTNGQTATFFPNLDDAATAELDWREQLDHDHDGVTDILDPDDDNDGILDTVEGTGDTDGDGIVDAFDLDSDNDGIPDVTEAGGNDPDGDGILGSGPFTDTDGDGLGDTVDPSTGGTALPNPDSDGDGIPNVLDLDSDNDGITDVIEGGGSDPDGDGIIGSGPIVDTDGDGLSDITDPSTGGTPLPLPNTDGLAGANYIDIDSDNDGIVDNIEGQTSGGYVAPSGLDTDGDGLDNAYDINNGGVAIVPVNTDGTDNVDYLDLDSDNDGDIDALEGWDTDNNGTANTIPSGVDADNDGLDDAYDNNDLAWNPTNGQTATSFPNLDDAATAELDWREVQDNDGDGITNNLDPDDDNDGILDTAEGTGDTDGDGIIDAYDLDSDNDGIPDVTEAGGNDPDGDGIIGTGTFTDTDNDGLADAIDPDNGGTALPNPDSDGDGIVNVLDLDSDNDGITDVTEAGGNDANGDGLVDGFTDTDNDGLSDNVDPVGPTIPGTPLDNPDTDGDGIVNVLDIDSDNDGITDVTEAGGTDANGDGRIDGYTDTDNDGLSDNVDPNNGGIQLPVGDADGDGIENYLDLDSDNDGITDVIEAGGSDPDNNGQIGTGTGAGIPDADNDGLSDVADTNNGGTILPIPNTDGTGGPNYLDIDADNDGIVDNIEGQTSLGYVAPSGNDTDGDGLDDAYDTSPGFGGAGIAVVNTDGADTPDYIDLDTDNDGDNDALEGWDTDNNGTANTIPLGTDSDGDGLDDAYDNNDVAWNPTNGQTATSFPNLDLVFTAELDWREVNDWDQDGISDNIDIDDDNDGITDVTENLTAGNAGDTDHDGIPDQYDLDSDNDGIADVIEGGGTDPDNDGVIGTGPIADADNDGLADVVDNATSDGLTPPDFDGDGHPDFQDLDSDNDGMNDLAESGGGQLDANSDGVVDGPDTDGDGIMDSADGSNGGTLTGNPQDMDGDSHPDYTDLDSDNDGINDLTESGNVVADTNSDGVVDGPDTDGDGINDSADANDGLYGDPDITDGAQDFDGDGNPDYTDLDSDNDGINDLTESQNPVTDANSDGVVDGPDSDGDGINDSADASNGTYGDADVNDTPIDFDGDGTPDYNDLDSDNDGINDLIESGHPGTDANSDGVVDGPDTDGDGINDSADNDDGAFGDPDPNDTPIDTDNDNHPDYNDLDSDNDGIDDLVESGNPVADANSDGVVDGPDSDGDGINDSADGSTGTYGDQDTGDTPVDTDGDGTPDYQDLDSDNDGITDVIEGGNGQYDPDGDGMVNGTDTDGDGVIDVVDGDINGYGDPDTGDTPPDTDGDGTPDYQDLDSDNDGINDGNGTELPTEDCDNDGIPNNLDPDACEVSVPQGFSPNGNGVNDTFVIHGLNLSQYPNNTFSVYNRWGNLVYSKAPYDNSWDGTSTADINAGNNILPVGTYFYFLDLGNGSKPLTGYIYLNR